jgi:dihydrofolate reductase
MDVSLIVAMAENGIIGRNNQLPWYLPEDLRYFKKVTMGKPIIMGRKTFESIGKALPGRLNIVVSQQKNLTLPEGVRLVGSIDAAIAMAESVALIDGIDEVMVIGGEQIYALAMPKATRLYLTKVHAAVDGDACFNQFDEKAWKLVQQEDFSASENNPYNYSFCVYQRKS